MPKAFVAVERWSPPGCQMLIVLGSNSILNQSSVNLRDRSAAWQKSGWKTFDPASKPYDAEQVRKERQLYAGGMR